MNTIDFIEKAKEMHGDKYDYSKTVYINGSTKVCIICPKHGEFNIRPNDMLNGQGCKLCGIEKNKIEKVSNTNILLKKQKKYMVINMIIQKSNI